MDVTIECDVDWPGWKGPAVARPLSSHSYSFDTAKNGKRRQTPSPRPATPQISHEGRASQTSQNGMPGQEGAPGQADDPAGSTLSAPSHGECAEEATSDEEDQVSDEDCSDVEDDKGSGGEDHMQPHSFCVHWQDFLETCRFAAAVHLIGLSCTSMAPLHVTVITDLN